MKQLMFILAIFILASCNSEGPEDAVLTNTAETPPTPVEPVVKKFTNKFEVPTYGPTVYYFNEMGMSYMMIINRNGSSETTNFTIDSLRAEWFKSQLKSK